MKLDKSYIPQEGFEPVKNYRNDPEGEAVVGYGRERESGFEFRLVTPVALPLVAYGKVYSTGWDIPNLWAIDSAKQCYVNDAHGYALEPCSLRNLLSVCETEEDRNAIRRHYGLKPELPSWVRAAKAAGWTPPASWKDEDYES